LVLQHRPGELPPLKCGRLARRLIDRAKKLIRAADELDEVAPDFLIAVLDGSQKSGSAGYVLPEMGVRILDDDDREMATGEVGEICIRPTEPHLTFSGYYERPEVTAKAFRNLWLHSGDLGRVDEDGERGRQQRQHHRLE